MSNISLNVNQLFSVFAFVFAATLFFFVYTVDGEAVNAVPPVIMNTVQDGERLIDYGTNAENTVFFTETAITESDGTEAVYFRSWRNGEKVVEKKLSTDSAADK